MKTFLPLRRLLSGGLLAVFASIASLGSGRAQSSLPGALDPNFDPGAGPDGVVNALVVRRADGKIIAGGAFRQVAGSSRSGVARFLSDGKLDPSFDPGTGAADGEVFAVVLQPDGKVLVGGSFSSFNGAARPGLVRLRTDGIVDSAFQPLTGLAGETHAVAIQSDGKILVGGTYKDADGTPSFFLTRLNADGSLDPGFISVSPRDFAPAGLVRALALQDDGRIVFGGGFETGYPSLVRLNADGSRDSGFVTQRPETPVYSIALQADGKIVYASFTDANFFVAPDRSVAGVFRLNPDGSKDESFLGLGYQDGSFFAVAVQPDGKILYGGSVASRASFGSGGDVGRLTPGRGLGDDTLSSTVAAKVTQVLALQPDGKVVIGGSFTSVNGKARVRLARLDNDPGGVSSFFTGAASVGGGFDYLAFNNGVPFGYYYAGLSSYLYHNDLDFEYVVDAANGRRGVYLYDFKLGTFFYTEPALWPYLYNFSAAAFFYYFPDTARPGHYTTNPRVFYNFGNGQFVFSP